MHPNAVRLASTSHVQKEQSARTLPLLLELSKPGITLMEVVTAVVGFWVARPWEHFGTGELLLRLGGLAIGVLLLGASAGALNHLVERSNDARMLRTALRPLASGRLSVRGGTVFAVAMFIAGSVALVALDWMVALLGIATVVLYIAVYTPLKTISPLALYIGGIPGALPVVGGWVAGGGSLLSIEALVLGLIMFWWQLPHFLALAIMYADDYRRGGFALLADGAAKPLAWHIFFYSVLLIVSASCWSIVGRAGVLYTLGCVVLSVLLLVRCIELVRQPSASQGRAVLMATYVFLMGLFLLAAVDVR
ncbi:MAG: protoheme IX farnesyltransferase [Bacteroidota bacterium]|nr:protoheme IX farnesyltransferase [Candidatus Kapabacteria bacterium]MCS7302137.1 protoheme IX farnesyltransferase [Candidatus Kapabacteria bacterium]MCX7936434.1 protoheme IX farnesyltransferase [Chlorobiota bacterium]MDW8074286.1 protoheme IX farnesyltransferase [Bacteroidota bacterium]MDW8271238.1 protoheme IX farnesyltransferase [Bacteroidota bacterium]